MLQEGAQLDRPCRVHALHAQGQAPALAGGLGIGQLLEHPAVGVGADDGARPRVGRQRVSAGPAKSTTYCCWAASSGECAVAAAAAVCTHAAAGRCACASPCHAARSGSPAAAPGARQLLRAPSTRRCCRWSRRACELHQLDAARGPSDPWARPRRSAAARSAPPRPRSCRTRGRAASGRSRAAFCVEKLVTSGPRGFSSGPPQPFAVAGGDHQAVRVVHLRAGSPSDAAGSRRRRTCW